MCVALQATPTGGTDIAICDLQWGAGDANEGPPRPALMTYFVVGVSLGTHQDTLAFSLQSNPYLAYWWLFTLLRTTVSV